MSLARTTERDAPFLSIPPFPNARLSEFARSAETAAALSDGELDALLEQLAAARVGGTYWGSQPPLGSNSYVLVTSPLGHSDISSAADSTLIWSRDGAKDPVTSAQNLVIGECDPWHMLSGTSELICRPDDPLGLIAALAGVPVRYDDNASGPARRLSQVECRTLLRSLLGPQPYLDPFTGSAMTWAQVIELCSSWRRLIDSNRVLAAAYGFAGWKRTTVEPLLWDGSSDERFDRSPSTLHRGDKAAVWRSRVSPAILSSLEQAEISLVEVEDGFIRSVGLGANCVPPQSIVVDPVGVHFDARSPSELEHILQEGQFDPTLLARAEALRANIVKLGLSKYDVGHEPLDRRGERLHLLVPGQVEDDRAVLSCIGSPLSNLDLLRLVRAGRADAYIIYKPHPDVEAGHRRGGMPDSTALEFADEVVREPSISSWIDLVDEVHVNSSLAGFEALLRDKGVTTYGVPFYAGWGLTEDKGPVPRRRTARRSLTELVAATLITYPRYVDPVTNLPCSPEALITRLVEQGQSPARRGRMLVRARQVQGWLARKFQALGRRP